MDYMETTTTSLLSNAIRLHALLENGKIRVFSIKIIASAVKQTQVGDIFNIF